MGRPARARSAPLHAAWVLLALMTMAPATPAEAGTTITNFTAVGPSPLARPNAANDTNVTLVLGGYTSPGRAIDAFCCSNGAQQGCAPSEFTKVSAAAGRWELSGRQASGEEPWTLEAGPDGVRTVTCWLRDDANVTSAAASIDVLLDTQLPGPLRRALDNCTTVAVGSANLTGFAWEIGLQLGACCSANPNFWEDCAARVEWIATPPGPTGYPTPLADPKNYEVKCTYEVGPFGMPAPDGSVYDVHLFLVDSAGNVASFDSVLEVDRTPPVVTMTLNGGANFTTNASVLVEVAAADRHGVSAMCVGEDPTTCAWKPFSSSFYHKFSDTTPGDLDGARRSLSVRLRDSCGAASQAGQGASAAIVIDAVKPKVSYQLLTASNYSYCTSSYDLSIWIKATDGGAGPMSYCLSAAPGDASCAWQDIGSGSADLVVNWTLASREWNDIYIYVADEPGGRGNRYSSYTFMTVDDVPPKGGALKLNGGAAVTNDLAIQAAVIGASDYNGVGKLCFTLGPGACSDWVLSGAKATPVRLPPGPSGTTYTVYAYVQDNCGATTTEPLAANITYMAGAPDAPKVQVVQGGVTGPAAVPLANISLAIMLPSSTPPGYAPMICVSNTPSCTAGFEPFKPLRNWTLPAQGLCTVYAWLRDDLNRVSPAGQVTVDHSNTSALLALADGQEAVTNSGTVKLQATSCTATVEMCITDKPVKSGRCPKWEPYNTAKTLRLSGDGQRTITAYFRRGETGTPWGPATTTLLYDKTPPKMLKAPVALSGLAAQKEQYIISFNAAATDGEPRGSGVQDYLLAWSDAATPPPKCGVAPSLLLPVTMGADGRGTAVMSGVLWSQLAARYRFRLCARDKAGNVAAGLVLVPDKTKPPPGCIVATGALAQGGRRLRENGPGCILS